MSRRHNSSHKLFFHPIIIATALAAFAGSASADLYIRDDPSDTGAEPNPSSGPMYTSPDIWVRTDPMPGWNPRPYQSASPPPWVDATHHNPDYRSPLSGKPNYIYVRIKNKGSASSGSERLLLYWASASTGLSWDPAKVGGSFIDNVQNGVLFGAEITKPRKNAATATQAERDAYVAALRKIATNAAFVFPGGVSYWRNQQEVHRFGPTYRHGHKVGNVWVPSVAFLPWHREMMNRYEGLLQEADPTVKLLYWQWTQNPTTPFDYTPMMGAFGTGNPSTAVQIGAPLSPDTDAGYPDDFDGLSKVTRRQQAGGPQAQPDTTVVGRTDYDFGGIGKQRILRGAGEPQPQWLSCLYRKLAHQWRSVDARRPVIPALCRARSVLLPLARQGRRIVGALATQVARQSRPGHHLRHRRGKRNHHRHHGAVGRHRRPGRRPSARPAGG